MTRIWTFSRSIRLHTPLPQQIRSEPVEIGGGEQHYLVHIQRWDLRFAKYSDSQDLGLS